MTFRKFVANNVFRNKRLYVAYFLSSLFTVLVFFTFANFAFHPTLMGEEINSNATLGMLVAGGIIYFFSFFFILYSMSQFLQSRKKEFGILLTQGMSNRQIRWMVFLENMLLGFFATIFGIGFGFLLSKAILLVAENVLIIEEHLFFYWPTTALLLTFFSFMFLFFLISLFIAFILRTSKLITLVKGDQMGKEEPNASILLTIFALLLLGSGYYIALTSKGIQVVHALLPVVLLVIFGTYLFFTQLSVYFIHWFKKRKNIFWNKTNMILLSDLSYRMKDNARSFFMVAIISTVAFSAIGTLTGLNSYLTKEMKIANPISYMYYGEDEAFSEKIETYIEDYEITTDYAQIELNNFEQNGEIVLITTPEDYNAIARLIGKKEIHLADDEVTIVEESARNLLQSDISLEDAGVVLADGAFVQVEKDKIGIAEPDVLPEIFPYYIVGEEIFKQLDPPQTGGNIEAWQVINGKQEDIIEVGKILSEETHEFVAIDWLLYNIKTIWSPIMFVGLFIGIVFFISAGSFLYFRLYTDLEEDKNKFQSIYKIGLTTKEMSRVISVQIGILFFVPISIALLHGAVSLTALAHLFDYNLLYESTLVLGSFLLIQILYYLIVRFLYAKQVKRAVYN